MNLSSDYAEFCRAWASGKHQTLSTSIVSDLETPVSAMLKLGQGKPFSFLLESIEGGAVRGRYSIIGRDPDLIWRTNKGSAEISRDASIDAKSFTKQEKPPLDDLRALLQECRIDEPGQPEPMAAGLFGYLGYDMVRHMEKLPDIKPPWLDVPESILIRPTLLAIFDQIENKFTLVTPVWFDALADRETAYAAAVARLQKALADLQQPLPLALPASLDFRQPAVAANMTEADYVDIVARAKDYIRAGDIFQVVLSQRFSQPFALPPLALYRAIRRLDPSPFLFFFDWGDFAVVGSSPEILVRARDNKITIRPIAGTRARHQNNQSSPNDSDATNRTDQELEADLLSDPKELAEHLMLLDLGRNDVGRVARMGSVKVTARNTVEYYKHVMHIVSNVEGDLDPRYDALDALIAGFPAGTVSGAPKIRAMQIIDELEPDRRGIYGGCIGYFGANGTMDTCIAIRTTVIKDGVMHVQAGAGIVYDSDPQAEYRECAAKARGMIRAAEAAVEFAKN